MTIAAGGPVVWGVFVFNLFPDAFVHDLEFAASRYHMYFLLVSMQIYLLFPLIRWTAKKTEGYHWWLCAASGKPSHPLEHRSQTSTRTSPASRPRPRSGRWKSPSPADLRGNRPARSSNSAGFFASPCSPKDPP